MELVSVIMPCFNAQNTVLNSIESVVNSGYPKIELICIDDGSTDLTSSILLSASQKYACLKIITRIENGGVAAARNDGLRIATGRYIAFCDSDDLWHPNKLYIQIDLMNATGAKCAHGAVIRRQESTGSEVTFTPKLHVTFDDMKIRNWIVNSTGIYDAREVGSFEQKSIHHEDYHMWLQIIRQCGRSVSSPVPVATYLIHDNNLTKNKLKSIVWHLGVQRMIGMKFREMALYFIKNMISRI